MANFDGIPDALRYIIKRDNALTNKTTWWSAQKKWVEDFTDATFFKNDGEAFSFLTEIIEANNVEVLHFDVEVVLLLRTAA